MDIKGWRMDRVFQIVKKWMGLFISNSGDTR